MNLHLWPDYIIRKGFWLSCALLISSLVLSLWGRVQPFLFPLLRRYAACSQTSAAIVLAAALVGGLLLEDILRRKGES